MGTIGLIVLGLAALGGLAWWLKTSGIIRNWLAQLTVEPTTLGSLPRRGCMTCPKSAYQLEL